MIICPFCNSSEWNVVHRSAIDPAEDRFKCRKCSRYFTRYEKSKAPAAAKQPADLLTVHIRGRGGKLTVEARPIESGGLNIRIDDERNPEFWAEVFIPTETLKAALTDAQRLNLE